MSLFTLSQINPLISVMSTIITICEAPPEALNVQRQESWAYERLLKVLVLRMSRISGGRIIQAAGEANVKAQRSTGNIVSSAVKVLTRLW